MVAREFLSLNESTPQILAPQSGDSYLAPRPVAISIGTITTDLKVLDLSATWNAAGVTFTGLKLNATTTASAAASLLIDLQASTVSKFSVSKVGGITIPVSTDYNNTANAHGISFGDYKLIGYNGTFEFCNTVAVGSIPVSLGIFSGADDGVHVNSGGVYAWAAHATNSYNAPDLILARDAADTLALRRTTNAQTLRLYNTYTDASNYERGFKRFASNVLEIGVEVAGTGTARNMDLLNAGVSTASRVQMGTSTGRAPIVGTANVNNTAVGNAGSGEDDLITYSLPANSLSGNGKGVHITAWGTTANNANAKTLKLYFGAVMLTNSLTVNLAGVWRIEADVFRTGSNAQDYVSQLVTTGAAGVALNDIEVGSLTQTDSGAITIKCTGEATSDNDIVMEGLFVKFIN